MGFNLTIENGLGASFSFRQYRFLAVENEPSQSGGDPNAVDVSVWRSVASQLQLYDRCGTEVVPDWNKRIEVTHCAPHHSIVQIALLKSSFVTPKRDSKKRLNTTHVIECWICLDCKILAMGICRTNRTD